jgi:hypothetical protein
MTYPVLSLGQSSPHAERTVDKCNAGTLSLRSKPNQDLCQYIPTFPSVLIAINAVGAHEEPLANDGLEAFHPRATPENQIAEHGREPDVRSRKHVETCLTAVGRHAQMIRISNKGSRVMSRLRFGSA